jgi:hypothetical protein
MINNYDLAGFPDENGNLGRPVPAGQIIVPQKIWLKDNCIHWKMGKPRMREVSRSMLNQFIRLRDADSILRFATEWGVLALSDNLWIGNEPGGPSHLPGRHGIKAGAEPVFAWQYYAKRAQAVLNVAAALKQGKLGDMSDWDKFDAFLLGPRKRERFMEWGYERMVQPNFGFALNIYNGLDTYEEHLEVARNAISEEIRAWLVCWRKDRTDHPSDFTLRWIDEKQRWDLQIDYHTQLFPAIALQLALVLADADSLYSCSGCGIPYVRPRERKRPKSGWANYCDQCSGDGVAQRRAAESYREKRSQAVRLHSGGTSIAEIAEQLKTDPARVRGWVKKRAEGGKTKTRK